MDDPDFLLRFQNEAASTGRIHHPNVVTIYESGQADDGTPYIAMEFLEGESLREALKRRGPLPVPEVAEILQQAARGLNAAHKLGIIHRDLKPDNIFLMRGEEGEMVVKAVDFGIAKLLQGESATQTQTGMVLGTPAYMSFEQVSGMRSDELDALSDVYSLGVVVYEMLTGRTPFYSDTPVGYLRMHMQEDPPPFLAVAPGLPVSLQVEAVVMKSLTKRRDQRHASVLDFARELAAAIQPRSAPEVGKPILSTKIVLPLEQPTPGSKGATKVNPKDGLKYVWVPPGTFVMGCSPGDAECKDDEKPPHQVAITKGFWLGQTEVTVGAYKRFAAGTGKDMPSAPDFNQDWSNEQMPMVNASWDDAQAYCAWAGGRLPTEAEWEYAARAGNTAARYDDLDEIAWYADNSGRQRLDSERIWKEDPGNYSKRLDENGNHMHEVGQKRANGFGLYDMLGNAWEWVNDWCDANYYKNSPSQDPSGPTSGRQRVLRGGGSWTNFPGIVRVSIRNRYYRTLRRTLNYVSFRCGGEVFAPSTGSHQPSEKLSPEQKHRLFQSVKESMEEEQGFRDKLRQQGAYREAARLNANNEQAHVGLGWTRGEKGDWDGAITEYREALRLNPNNALAHVSLGVALENKGDRRGALEEYRAAYTLDPKDADHKQNYERLLQQVNQ